MSNEVDEQFSEIDSLKARLLDANDKIATMEQNFNNALQYLINEAGLDPETEVEDLAGLLQAIVEAFKEGSGKGSSEET